MLGIPVACSRLPTLEEHFGEDELLGNPAELARAFVAIAQDSAGAVQRAERARARCEGYRWQRNAEIYASLLDRLC